MATLPTFSKTWNFDKINQRIPYVSLNDTMATFLFAMKDYLVSTMGAAVVMSCDGTTGPTTSADTTDRWLSKANCTTRGASTSAANSWIVIAWAGVQFCLSYVGPSDDVARLSFSQGSLFVPAGTATFTPTATDEAVMCNATSVVNNTTSGDRVFSIVATDDRSVVRFAVYRAGTLVRAFGLEQSAPAPNVTPGIVVGWNTQSTYANAATPSQGGSLGTASGTTGNNGTVVAYYAGTLIPVNGGGGVGGTVTPSSYEATPSLNAGAPVMPLFYTCTGTGRSGWLGTRYDAYIAWCSAVDGDTFDDVTAGTRCVVIGTILQPWSPVDGLLMA